MFKRYRRNLGSDKTEAQLFSQFQTLVREILGRDLSQRGFVEEGYSPIGLILSRPDLSVHVYYNERKLKMGIDVAPRPLPGELVGQAYDLQGVANLMGKDLKIWGLPNWVSKAEDLRPAIKKWSDAFFDVCAPLLSGDLSILRNAPVREEVQEARKRERIQLLYWESYGAWQDKDFPKLVALYDELTQLGYQLNDVQEQRLAAARAAMQNG